MCNLTYGNAWPHKIFEFWVWILYQNQFARVCLKLSISLQICPNSIQSCKLQKKKRGYSINANRSQTLWEQNGTFCETTLTINAHDNRMKTPISIKLISMCTVKYMNYSRKLRSYRSANASHFYFCSRNIWENIKNSSKIDSTCKVNNHEIHR